MFVHFSLNKNIIIVHYGATNPNNQHWVIRDDYFYPHLYQFEGGVVPSKISIRGTIIFVHEKCAIASTISLNLNRTVWLFILLSNTALSIRGDTRYRL
jgi:hypothetical protein